MITLPWWVFAVVVLVLALVLIIGRFSTIFSLWLWSRRKKDFKRVLGFESEPITLEKYLLLDQRLEKLLSDWSFYQDHQLRLTSLPNVDAEIRRFVRRLVWDCRVQVSEAMIASLDCGYVPSFLHFVQYRYLAERALSSRGEKAVDVGAEEVEGGD